MLTLVLASLLLACSAQKHKVVLPLSFTVTQSASAFGFQIETIGQAVDSTNGRELIEINFNPMFGMPPPFNAMLQRFDLGFALVFNQTNGVVAPGCQNVTLASHKMSDPWAMARNLTFAGTQKINGVVIDIYNTNEGDGGQFGVSQLTGLPYVYADQDVDTFFQNWMVAVPPASTFAIPPGIVCTPAPPMNMHAAQAKMAAAARSKTQH